MLDATRAARRAREAALCAGARHERPAPPIETAASSTSRWERRPLAAAAPVASVAPASPTAADRALAAELREARATLAIARDTTASQREEIVRLRRELAAGPTGGDSGAALAPLRARIVELEQEVERGAGERDRLQQLLAVHEQSLGERARAFEALRVRHEVQEQALEQARRLAEQERRRHTAVQSVLDRLRAALEGGEADGQADAKAASLPIAASDHASATPTAIADRVECVPVERAAAASEPASVPNPATACAGPTRTRRSAIFDWWRGEQIRRHFGPLGIDSLADLLREPLARRARSHAEPLVVLLAGTGAAEVARPLVDELLRTGAPELVLHVADPSCPDAPIGSADDPLRDALRFHAFAQDAVRFRAGLRALAPALVVSRDLLTGQPRVDEWLDALDEARRTGACLVLLEETGLGPIEPGAELTAIGERIWELLPERYTRAPGSAAAPASFAAAFAARPTAPANALLARLRTRFPLELCAQFGCLSEAFVAGPIADCFDPSAARDQRFLRQIADLDERRLEAGGAPALHLIARVEVDGPP